MLTGPVQDPTSEAAQEPQPAPAPADRPRGAAAPRRGAAQARRRQAQDPRPGRRRQRADRAARRAGRGEARGPGVDPGADAPHRGAVAPARQGRHAARRPQVAVLRPPAPGRGRQAARRARRRAQLRRARRRRADRRLAQRAVSRLFYRYEEGDAYEERLGDRLVEGEILARRTVAIVEAELRRVASPQGTFSRDIRSGQWRETATRQARLQIARDGSAAEIVGQAPVIPRRDALPPPPARRAASWVSTTPARAAPIATCPRSPRSSIRASSS